MISKMTPGPWVIKTYQGCLFKICKPDFKPGDEIANRLEADARAIAAVPEMIDALGQVLVFVENERNSGRHFQEIEMARLMTLFTAATQALVKAKGSP